MRRSTWAGLPLLLAGLASCGQDVANAGAAGAATSVAVPTPPAEEHRLIVWATTSLQAPLQALAREYERRAGKATVVLRCAGGDDLLTARNQGEPCDVVAIGDSSQMSRFAAAAHLAPHGVAELARNRLAIVVPAGNPGAIRELADLGRPGVRLAVGRRSASIGRYASWLLSAAQVAVEPAVRVASADAVLAEVAAGRADAGIVYTTTLRGAPTGVEGVAIAPAQNQPVLYSIAVDRQAAQPAGARAFVALACGEVGQRILRDAGFLPPGAK